MGVWKGGSLAVPLRHVRHRGRLCMGWVVRRRSVSTFVVGCGCAVVGKKRKFSSTGFDRWEVAVEDWL